MPIYEFFSPDTNKIYSFFARNLAQGSRTPRCPDKPGARMERAISRFAVTGRSKENSEGGPQNADPRMEKVMAEMEREMSGMDENNPDPKAIGRLMRKMTEATGQAMPSEMEQVVRRLEAGEDPERLEEEFGDSLANLDLPDPGIDGGGIPGPKPRKAPPTRDPALYEMADFI